MPAKIVIHCSAVATRDVARRLDRDARGVRARDDVVEREQRMRRDRAARRGTRRCRRRRSRRSTSASYSAASSCTGPRAVVMKNAVGFMRANCSRPISPSVSGVSGQFRCTKSERSSSSSSSTFVAPRAAASSSDEVRVVREHGHRERRAQLDQPAADLPDADDAERLAEQLAAPQRHAVLHHLAPDHAVGERDLLGQREHEPERVLGDRFAPGPRVVAHDHAGRGARVDVDDVVARARGAHREQIGATRRAAPDRRSTARRRPGCGPARCG